MDGEFQEFLGQYMRQPREERKRRLRGMIERIQKAHEIRRKMEAGEPLVEVTEQEEKGPGWLTRRLADLGIGVTKPLAPAMEFAAKMQERAAPFQVPLLPSVEGAREAAAGLRARVAELEEVAPAQDFFEAEGLGGKLGSAAQLMLRETPAFLAAEAMTGPLPVASARALTRTGRAGRATRAAIRARRGANVGAAYAVTSGEAFEDPSAIPEHAAAFAVFEPLLGLGADKLRNMVKLYQSRHAIKQDREFARNLGKMLDDIAARKREGGLEPRVGVDELFRSVRGEGTGRRHLMTVPERGVTHPPPHPGPRALSQSDNAALDVIAEGATIPGRAPLATPEERAAVEVRRRVAAMREAGQPVEPDAVAKMFEQVRDSGIGSRLARAIDGGLITDDGGFVSRALLMGMGRSLGGAAVGVALPAESAEDRFYHGIIGAATGAVGPRAVRGVYRAAARPGAAQEAVKSGQTQLKRWFRSGGLMTDPQKVAWRTTRGWANAEARAAAYLTGDIRGIARKQYGAAGVPEPVRQAMNDYLEAPFTNKPASLGQISQEFWEPLKALRNHMTTLSRQIRDSGAVSGDLLATIDQNLETYLHRSYRRFTDPRRWAREVPEEVKDRAFNFVQQEFPHLSPEEVWGRVDYLLDPSLEELASVVRQATIAGKKDITALLRRKDVPEAIRALWGEERDPLIRYLRTIQKQTNILANHRFLETVRADGMNKYLFETPRTIGGKKYTVQIAPREPVRGQPLAGYERHAALTRTQGVEPMKGLFTDEVTAMALRDAIDQPSATGPLMKWVLKGNALAKLSAVPMSLQAQVRNFTGNALIAVATGNWSPVHLNAARKAVLGDAFRAARSDQAWRDYILDLRRRFVIGQSVSGNELRAIFNDAQFRERGDLGMMMRKGIDVVGGIYQAGDDFWKVLGYESELAKLRKALPDLPEEELKRGAADLVVRLWPTYSVAPKVVTALRRFPLVAPFITFHSEMIRVTYNLLGQTAKELADPALRKIGAQRVAGILAAGGSVYGMTVAGRKAFDLGADRFNHYRRFLPWYQEHSNIVPVGVTDDGKLEYIDMTFTDPYQILRAPLNAILSGEDWEEKFFDALGELFEPVLGEELFAQRLLDLRTNQTRDGRRIWNPEASSNEKAETIARHVIGAFTPRVIQQTGKVVAGFAGERTKGGQEISPWKELASQASGLRVQEVFPPREFGYKAQDYQRRWRDANALVSALARSKGTVAPGQIEGAYREAEAARLEIVAKAHEDAQALIGLGWTTTKAIGVLRDAGWSKRDAQDIVVGIYRPQRFEPGALAGRAKSVRAVGGETAPAILEDLRARERLLVELSRMMPATRINP